MLFVLALLFSVSVVAAGSSCYTQGLQTTCAECTKNPNCYFCAAPGTPLNNTCVPRQDIFTLQCSTPWTSQGGCCYSNACESCLVPQMGCGYCERGSSCGVLPYMNATCPAKSLKTIASQCCSALKNCTSCRERSDCGWCPQWSGGTGRCYDEVNFQYYCNSLPLSTARRLSSQDCDCLSSSSDCTDCTRKQQCGFVAGGLCVAGNGSSPVTLVTDRSWMWFEQECNVTQGVCSQYQRNQCPSCLSFRDSCGYCQKTGACFLMEGTPNTKSPPCTVDDTVTDLYSCPYTPTSVFDPIGTPLLSVGFGLILVALVVALRRHGLVGYGSETWIPFKLTVFSISLSSISLTVMASYFDSIYLWQELRVYTVFIYGIVGMSLGLCCAGMVAVPTLIMHHWPHLKIAPIDTELRMNSLTLVVTTVFVSQLCGPPLPFPGTIIFLHIVILATFFLSLAVDLPFLYKNPHLLHETGTQRPRLLIATFASTLIIIIPLQFSAASLLAWEIKRTREYETNVLSFILSGVLCLTVYNANETRIYFSKGLSRRLETSVPLLEGTYPSPLPSPPSVVGIVAFAPFFTWVMILISCAVFIFPFNSSSSEALSVASYAILFLTLIMAACQQLSIAEGRDSLAVSLPIPGDVSALKNKNNLITLARSWVGKQTMVLGNYVISFIYFLATFTRYEGSEARALALGAIGLSGVGMGVTGVTLFCRFYPSYKITPTDDSMRISCLLKSALALMKSMIVISDGSRLGPMEYVVIVLLAISMIILGIITLADIQTLSENKEILKVRHPRLLLRCFIVRYIWVQIINLFAVIAAYLDHSTYVKNSLLGVLALNIFVIYGNNELCRYFECRRLEVDKQTDPMLRLGSSPSLDGVHSTAIFWTFASAGVFGMILVFGLLVGDLSQTAIICFISAVLTLIIAITNIIFHFALASPRVPREKVERKTNEPDVRDSAF